MSTMAGYDRSPNRTGSCPSCGGPFFGLDQCSECNEIFGKRNSSQKTCGPKCSRIRMNRRRRENDANGREITQQEKRI